MASVDPETPPEIQEKFDQHEKWMNADNLDEEDEEPEYVDTIESAPAVGNSPENFEAVKTLIKQNPKRKYKATLRHELYTVTFPIEDISIADYQLAIKIPRNDFRFEPAPQSKFILESMGENYPIVYVGGLFDFPSDSTWALTFLLDYDTPPTDKSE